MITTLIDGVRELRIPLTTGYASIFSAWFALADRASISGTLDDRFSQLHGFMGPGPTFALVTVCAALVGGVLDRWVIESLRSSLAVRSGHLNWQAAIRHPPFRKDGRPFYENSEEESSIAQAWFERQRSESDFRINSAIVLLPPAFLIAWHGSGWAWWIVVVVPVLLWADAVKIQNLARTQWASSAKTERLANIKTATDRTSSDEEIPIDLFRTHIEQLDKALADNISLIPLAHRGGLVMPVKSFDSGDAYEREHRGF